MRRPVWLDCCQALTLATSTVKLSMHSGHAGCRRGAASCSAAAAVEGPAAQPGGASSSGCAAAAAICSAQLCAALCSEDARVGAVALHSCMEVLGRQGRRRELRRALSVGTHGTALHARHSRRSTAQRGGRASGVRRPSCRALKMARSSAVGDTGAEGPRSAGGERGACSTQATRRERVLRHALTAGGALGHLVRLGDALLHGTAAPVRGRRVEGGEAACSRPHADGSRQASRTTTGSQTSDQGLPSRVPAGTSGSRTLRGWSCMLRG